MNFKEFIRAIIPVEIIDIRRRYLNMKAGAYWNKRLRDGSVEQIFSAVYKNKVWGGEESDFYSGSGSHNPTIVDPYVRSLRSYLSSLNKELKVLDLGCGDFNVGAQLCSLSKQYVAADIVPELISRNRVKFADLPVEFLCLNIVDDQMPSADIVLIRQVLQHLSNLEIEKVVRKLYSYQYVVVTEHLPGRVSFRSNRDKPAGPSTRMEVPFRPSAVVLTDPPFNFRPLSEQVLCEVKEAGGIIRTIAYKMS